MVALEVALVAASIWLAHWRLIFAIDESMYRMSLTRTGPIFMRLAQEGFAVLGLFMVINLIALMVAAKIWSHREDLVLRDFAKLIGKTRELDFSGDADTLRQHEVLALAAAWRSRERARFAVIREHAGKLEAAATGKESPQAMRSALESLNALFP